MPRRRTHTREQDNAEGGEQAHAPDQVEAGEHGQGNGSHAGARPSEAVAAQAQDGPAGSQAPAPPARQRAEEMVDRLAERLSHYAGVVGQKLRWLFARAREEAEDIWAEAKAISRGEHREPEGTPPQQQA
jgi:hypothetical protein